MKLLGFVWVKCPQCARTFALRNNPRSRRCVYVRMFTHIRLKHWDHYRELGRQEYVSFEGLID